MTNLMMSPWVGLASSPLSLRLTHTSQAENWGWIWTAEWLQLVCLQTAHLYRVEQPPAPDQRHHAVRQLAQLSPQELAHPLGVVRQLLLHQHLHTAVSTTTIPPSTLTSSAARATLHARGLPPYVLPCSPGLDRIIIKPIDTDQS